MDTRVLVAYASKHGATAEIAQRIGQVLAQSGLQVDVLRADRVAELAPYKAVVLGSAVYIGKWRKEAATFLKARETALVTRPVWLFSSGPTGEGDVVEMMKGWRFPAALQPIAERIQPRDMAIFLGALDEKKLNILDRWMIRKVKAPVGDFRNWDTIAAWATGIADALKETGAGSGTPSRR